MKKLLLFLSLQFAVTGTIFAGEVETKIEKPVEDAITILKDTQKDEVEWRLLQQKLTAQFDSLQAQVKEATHMRDTLTTEIALTRGRVSLKKGQLADIQRLEQEMNPFLHQLMAQLDQLPPRGLPFLLNERTTRIQKLHTLLIDPAISISEKYRKFMEALQIEADYGLTIETYQEMISLEDQSLLVNILRIGRIGLYYVNLDESGCGFYNIATKSWQPLTDNFIRPLQNGVAMADKRRPVEFINIPLGRMVKK